jgi:O-antigen ligase
MQVGPKAKTLDPFDTLFLASLALMVVVPDGSALALLVFGLWGMYKVFFGKGTGFHPFLVFGLAEPRLRALGFVLLVFVLGNSLSLAYHAASSSEYEQLIPFILFPFAAWLLVLKPVSLRVFFLGVALAAMSSGLFALVQVLWFDMPHQSRASGWMANPIHFGHLCVLVAAYCLIGLLGAWGRVAGRSPVLMLLGFGLALLGAVLSGSKSSWLAFAFFLVYLGLVGLQSGQLRRALLLKLGVFVALLFWAFLAFSPSSQRLETFHASVSALAAAVFQSNKPLNLSELSLDPSVNDRLAQYQMSADLIAQNPWLGISRPAINLEQENRVTAAAPGFNRVYRHIHSEYLDTLVNRGLIGFALLTLMFFALLWAVRKPVDWSKSAPAATELATFEVPPASGLVPAAKPVALDMSASSQARLLGTSTLLLLASMALFDILLSRVSVMAPGLFVLAYCLALLYGPARSNLG